MKYLALILILILSGCSVPEERGVMQGEEVNIYVEGYEEMCLREPQSPLCAPKERINWFLKEDNNNARTKQDQKDS